MFNTVYKSIAGFIAATLVAWFSKRGLATPTEVVTWITGVAEAAVGGLVGFVMVYFAPKNKPTVPAVEVPVTQLKPGTAEIKPGTTVTKA